MEVDRILEAEVDELQETLAELVRLLVKLVDHLRGAPSLTDVNVVAGLAWQEL